MKIVTVVGARPQFIKAAAMSRQLRRHHTEFLVHTGQHYDYAMSGVFFSGLEIPPPDVDLGVGSGTHGSQTGAMLSRIEEVLLAQEPDWLLVYGDTNSTLAGALAAAKLHIPIAHVEAGLRSFNRRMPEEINRIMADHLSELLLCPSEVAVGNLSREGISRNVQLVGDVMLDVLTWALQKLESQPANILPRLNLRPAEYLLVTVHRSENTDDPERLAGILGALSQVGESVVFPVHPRTRKAIAAGAYRVGQNVTLMDPVGYFEMIALSRSARLILTDSGGLQKEAYWLEVPCVTLRDETEWVETVESGWNTLVGSDTRRIIDAVGSVVTPRERRALYGDGQVALRCVRLMENCGALSPAETLQPA